MSSIYNNEKRLHLNEGQIHGEPPAEIYLFTIIMSDAHGTGTIRCVRPTDLKNEGRKGIPGPCKITPFNSRKSGAKVRILLSRRESGPSQSQPPRLSC